MKIAILGATGTVGQRIVKEAVRREHSVTAISRDPSRLMRQERVNTAAVDALDATALEDALHHHDALISAVGPGQGRPASVIVDVSRAIAAACMKSGVRRVLIVNGAGSLSVKPGLELLNTPEFPVSWREIALAHREALELWRKVKELDWTVASPAALMEPGERRGSYRVGHNDLLVDDRGQSRISAEDFALALLDELERGAHVHERITFAY